jgi:hypothetical protein
MMIRMSKPLTRTEDDVDRENLFIKDQVSHLKGQSFKGDSHENKHVSAMELVGSNLTFYILQIFD